MKTWFDTKRLEMRNKAVARLLLLLMLLNMLDFATTFVSLELGAEEANLLLLYAMEHLGGVWAILYVKLAILFSIFPYLMVYGKFPEVLEKYTRPRFIAGIYYLLIPVNLFYAYIVVHNLNIIWELS